MNISSVTIRLNIHKCFLRESNAYDEDLRKYIMDENDALSE